MVEHVALSIALLMYHAIKKTLSKPATNIQHKVMVDRETPLAIYIALKMYGATEHCQETPNQLHKFGIYSHDLEPYTCDDFFLK